MISFWSVFSSSLWFALVSMLIYALHRREDLLMRYGVAAWSSAVILAVVRLLTPVDNEHMVILRSYTVLPALDRALRYELLAGVTVERLLAIIWLAGALLGIVLILCGVLRDRRCLRQLPKVPLSPPIRAAIQACGLSETNVCVTSAAVTPMAVGILHPIICLPDVEYSETELCWILRHEATHISGKDGWLRLGYLLFRCFFWWNPFVHGGQKSVDDILELRCDKAVLEKVDPSERTEYAETLFHMAQKIHQRGHSFIGAGTFVPAKKDAILVLRARQAMDAPRPSRVAVASVIGLSVLLFVTSYAFILQPAGFPSDMEGGVRIYQSSPGATYLKAVPTGGYELWCGGEYVGYITENMRNDEAYIALEVLP